MTDLPPDEAWAAYNLDCDAFAWGRLTPDQLLASRERLTTALCAWQRAQDVKALRKGANETLEDELEYYFLKAADHLEALK